MEGQIEMNSPRLEFLTGGAGFFVRFQSTEQRRMFFSIFGSVNILFSVIRFQE